MFVSCLRFSKDMRDWTKIVLLLLSARTQEHNTGTEKSKRVCHKTGMCLRKSAHGSDLCVCVDVVLFLFSRPLTRLVLLDISNNEIEALDPGATIPRQLSFLTYHGNPCCAEPTLGYVLASPSLWACLLALSATLTQAAHCSLPLPLFF